MLGILVYEFNMDFRMFAVVFCDEEFRRAFHRNIIVYREATDLCHRGFMIKMKIL